MVMDSHYCKHKGFAQMAESTMNGNGERLQKAAESAVLQLVARWGIVGICAVALPAGAWMGTRLIDTLDKVVSSVASLQTDMAVVKTDIGYLKEKVKP